jgi:hypothetical protein
LNEFGTKIGYGIIKKRRGRPRGSGLVKEKPIKIPNFVGFGINEINQKSLKNGIVTIRRNTKSNIKELPSRRVSDKLKNVVNAIIGGGVPKFNDLNGLDEDEKNYLHKIISKSELEDKLSIPAPSKDKQEKDIHQFEVLKGQLMSGNDSKELVKQFKLLALRLSKQGLLPKNEVNELFELLITLGY